MSACACVCTKASEWGSSSWRVGDPVHKGRSSLLCGSQHPDHYFQWPSHWKILCVRTLHGSLLPPLCHLRDTRKLLSHSVYIYSVPASGCINMYMLESLKSPVETKKIWSLHSLSFLGLKAPRLLMNVASGGSLHIFVTCARFVFFSF